MSTLINLAPLFQDAVDGAVILLAGVISWGVHRAATRLHMDAQGEMAKAVIAALDMGLSWAAHQAQVKIQPGLSVDLKNQLAADAATYVMDHYKEWLKKLGMSEQALIDTALAKLPQ